MTTLILHVGMPKTGTSSLQESLLGFANDRFVWYIDQKRRPNHTAEVFNIVGLPGPALAEAGQIGDVAADQRAARNQFEKAIGSLNGRTLVVSGEGIPRLPVRPLREFADYLRERGVTKITVFGYIRPPGSHVTSVARAKMGGRLDGFAFNRRGTHYRDQLEKFDLVFGRDNVVWRKFDPSHFPKGDVVQDFCSRFGIDFPPKGTIRVNESLSREGVALLYLYRKYGPNGAADVRGGKRLRLVNELAKIGSKKFQFAPELLQDLAAGNREDIAWMEARLGDSLHEDFGERQAGDVRNETDLIEHASAGVDELLKILGKNAPAQADRHSPEGIAALVARLVEPAGVAKLPTQESMPKPAIRPHANILRSGELKTAPAAPVVDRQTFSTSGSGTQTFLFYPQLSKEPWCRLSPLPVETFDNAVITPIKRMGAVRRQFTGGVYDASGNLISYADRQIGRGTKAANAQHLQISNARHVQGRSYFAGILFPNFGHALIEMLSRLWAVSDLDSPPDRFLFQAWSRKGVAEVFERPFARYLLESLGIHQAQCEVVDQPVRCDQLIVPASTISINDHCHPRFIDVYDKILGTRSFGGSSIKRVYLSRRGLSDDHRKATNEEQIEGLFAARGFAILRPETIPFEEQIRIMQGAEVVAGTDGSAMHMTAFARPAATVFAIDCRVSPNQYAVEAARGINAIHVMTTDGRPGRAPWEAKLDRVERGLELLEKAR